MQKLDIGCGPHKREGFVGVDKYYPDADVKAPAHELPYGDGEIDEISTSHMVEHLPPDEFIAALKEWHRVLKRGGRLTIRCPNFPLYVREFLEADFEYRWGWGIRNLLGWQGRGPGYLNRNGFSVRRLRAILPKHGFKILRCETTRTRARKGSPEYRPNGDIVCVCKKA